MNDDAEKGKVTLILEGVCNGDAGDAAELLPLVYAELRRLAAKKMAHERPGQTLQATALVHEAYLRLVAAGCNISYVPFSRVLRPPTTGFATGPVGAAE
jgi:hypothetical protein